MNHQLTGIWQRSERNVSNATTRTQALEAAIDAAEHYMQALTLETAPRNKQSLDAKCKELLTKAENIKKSKDWHRGGDRHASRLQAPVSTRQLTTREEIILLEGAKLSGFVFPPWSEFPDPSEFESISEGYFTYVKSTR